MIGDQQRVIHVYWRLELIARPYLLISGRPGCQIGGRKSGRFKRGKIKYENRANNLAYWNLGR